MAQKKETFVVEHDDQPLLASVAAHVGAAAAPALIERGAVWVDRRRVLDPALVPPPGAQIDVHFPPSGHYDTVALTPEDVLWEDEVLLAINKRPGWHTNYNPWDMWGSLRHALGVWLHRRDGVERPIHLLHQLDRDTSGVLLASKSPLINARMQHLFASSEIHKTYLALVAGNIEADALEVQTGHGRGHSGLFRVYPLDEVGRMLPFGKQRVRHMHTRFQVVERFEEATLLRALPVTGRTHQIRLHLQYIGHPILGDTRYGGPTMLKHMSLEHHLLHAAQLSLPHPVTNQPLVLEAPLPLLWQQVLHVLRKSK
jgi:23S rRNA pseudouridine1911/1915/1917 synthase